VTGRLRLDLAIDCLDRLEDVMASYARALNDVPVESELHSYLLGHFNQLRRMRGALSLRLTESHS